ncbi:MYCBP-associated protein [Cololabis saira]|uniref:MYCBP-associated protein n=1 Tax=Cololabis saira TaxID=129043 RepID=UPI002AD49BAE|nr:MYCBP-associated protein [Cololabis saira]
MILPHSILGSLEDFRSYLEAKGETELVKRIPTSVNNYTSETTGRRHINTVKRESFSAHRNIQSNALQNWEQHARHRRQQQDFLSHLLNEPVENLLMNKANHFREIQEQREILNQALPNIFSGYGYRVGSEFWSLPQHLGDEMSGITATLTQTELGKQKPITRVGQPNSIRQQLGLSAETPKNPAGWDQSVYLQQQCQELKDVLEDMDIRKPDISAIEVVCSGKPFIPECRSPLMEDKEEEKGHKEMKERNLGPLAKFDDVQIEPKPIPALRVCGQLASWTGNVPSKQGEVGISTSITFEALVGEVALSNLELHNEGTTTIFYSWTKITPPQRFTHLHSQTKTAFYFNTSPGVILPRETQQIEFIFKSYNQGVRTELWQLNTHPLLMQGASMQLGLMGVSLCQDKTADQRLFLETKLEKKVAKNICRSIVYEVLQGVHSPERPSSPTELYITEEQQFWIKNPEFQDLKNPVEALERMWLKVSPGHAWDLSVDTLRQTVLSLPHEGASLESSAREESLVDLNALLLQLSEPSLLKRHNPTALAIGQQSWKKLLDTMSEEAMRLRPLLGLPEKKGWIDENQESILSPDVGGNAHKDDQNEKKSEGSEESINVQRSKSKDDSRPQSKPPMVKKPVKDDVRKPAKTKKGKESISPITAPENIIQQPVEEQCVNSEEELHTYKRLLHRKVYGLMEDLLDNMCDRMDGLTEGEEQETDN